MLTGVTTNSMERRAETSRFARSMLIDHLGANDTERLSN